MPKKEPKKDRGVFERPAESGVWWICYFDQYGRKHRECVGMKSTALKVYQQRKTEIRHGKFDPEDIKRKHPKRDCSGDHRGLSKGVRSKRPQIAA